jgi:hypothetical protein
MACIRTTLYLSTTEYEAAVVAAAVAVMVIENNYSLPCFGLRPSS